MSASQGEHSGVTWEPGLHKDLCCHIELTSFCENVVVGGQCNHRSFGTALASAQAQAEAASARLKVADSASPGISQGTEKIEGIMIAL